MSTSIVTSAAFLPILVVVDVALITLALLLRRARRSVQFPTWLRAAAPVIGIPLAAAGLFVLVQAARIHDRSPLVSATVSRLGDVVIPTVAFLWLGGIVVFAAGHWPPKPRLAGLLTGAGLVDVACMLFAVVGREQLVLSALLALVWLLMTGAMVRTRWMLLVAPVVVVAVSYLLRFWGLIGEDLREGMAEEERNAGAAIFFVLVWVLAVPVSALAVSLGAVLGAHRARPHEPAS